MFFIFLLSEITWVVLYGSNISFPFSGVLEVNVYLMVSLHHHLLTVTGPTGVVGVDVAVSADGVSEHVIVRVQIRG